eukprot:SAG11_NODE_1030_length_6119_cov_7.559302_9_plen_133_part_00
MNLEEAKIAANLACRAWRASERALEILLTDCARIERGAQAVRDVHVQLMRARRGRVAERARSGGMRKQKEQKREGLVRFVGQMHAKSQAWLATARMELDKYYWGVWGSARRCKASAREVQVLEAELHEAELV